MLLSAARSEWHGQQPLLTATAERATPRDAQVSSCQYGVFGGHTLQELNYILAESALSRADSIIEHWRHSAGIGMQQRLSHDAAFLVRACQASTAC